MQRPQPSKPFGDIFPNIPPSLGGQLFVAGRNVDIAVNPFSVASPQIPNGVIPVPSSISLANEGNGTGFIYDTMIGATALLRSLIADPASGNGGIVITTDIVDRVVDIGNSMTGANLGAGQPIFVSKTAPGILQFNSLIAGTNVTITPQGGGGLLINAATQSQLWEYAADTNTLHSSVALNPAFPGAVIPSDLVFPGVSTEASGITLIFDASNGAFRAGSVGGSQWTQANRGANSAAFGLNNTASGARSTVAGGQNNAAADIEAFVGAGNGNTVTTGGSDAFIGAGTSNQVASSTAFIGAGIGNAVAVGGAQAGIGCGSSNTVSGSGAFIGGGASNIASGNNSFVGGGGGNTASGSEATIPGGDGNTCAGLRSFAAGRHANDNTNTNTFVWADSGGFTVPDAAAAHPDTVWFHTGTTATAATPVFSIYSSTGTASGVVLNQGSSAWAAVCDRNAKENIRALDPQEVLARVEKLPIYTFNYKGVGPGLVTMGPMAQDWHACFPSEKDPLKIETLDLDGVALASIKGLAELVRKLQARVAQLEADAAKPATGTGKATKKW